MTITRRQFGRRAAAAAPIVTTTCSSPSLVAQPKLDSRIHGVQIGVISGSFQDIPVSELIHSIVDSFFPVDNPPRPSTWKTVHFEMI